MNTESQQPSLSRGRNRTGNQVSPPPPQAVPHHTQILESHDYYGVSEIFCWLYGISLALMLWQASEDRFVALRIGRWYFGHVIYLLLLFPALFGLKYHLAFLSLRVGAVVAPGLQLNSVPRERTYALTTFIVGIVATLANLGFALKNTMLLFSTECAAHVWCIQHVWNLVLICILAYFMALISLGHVTYTLLRRITPLFLYTESISVEATRKHYS